MTSTYQTNLTDEAYHGWTNYETWNVSLWIQNLQILYNMARLCHSYQDFIDQYFEDGDATPDGVKWNDVNLNFVELDEMIEEL